MNTAERLTQEIAALRSPSADLSGIKVSKKSCIYDMTWDFTEDPEHRPRSISDAKLLVQWDKWPLSPALRQEVQRIFGLYRKSPGLLSKQKQEVKANTFVTKILRSLDFLSDVVQIFATPDLIESLDQITLVDLKEAAKIHPGQSHDSIRQGLSVLFHPNAAEFLDKDFEITPEDIKRLSLKKIQDEKTPEQVAQELEGPALFPDELFALLSDEATARVQYFLRRLDLSPEDAFTYPYKAPAAVENCYNFTEAHFIYEQWRRKNKGLSTIALHMGVTHIRRYLIEQLDISPSDLRDYLAEVNLAAQCVLGLYVGPRFSELTSLQVGCITERDGVPSIIGRNFKGKRDSNKLDDAWVAIPAVRDAVRALEQLAGIKNNDFLFSSLDTAGGTSPRYSRAKNEGTSYSSGGLARAMEGFIKLADKTGRYQGWTFNSHQFKHSLARQLIKAKLGLAYISFHLKHLHTRISSLPSDVTLGYGNAGKTLQSEVAGFQLQEVRRDMARKMYDPDSPVHGGAAAEFDERRKTYFKGMVDAGMTKEQILDDLARVGGSSFVNVGLGYCTGRKNDPESGKKPPCIGSLRCNPNQCSNAIITKEAHGSAWQRIAFDNRKMARDPRFTYGKPQFEAAAREAEEVCRRLGVEVGDE